MTEEPMNCYGDARIQTTGLHGVDIASQRLDDLDKESLRQVLSLEDPRITCLDLGCGLGWHGARLAMLGARVHTFDLLPESPFLRFLREDTRLSLSHWAGDLRQLKPQDLPERVDLAFSQRFIHYLTYTEANRFIRTVAERSSPAAYFYLSASGLNSEFGQDYSCASVEIQNRFAPLSDRIGSKHNILEPVCLYSETELSGLMESNGYGTCKVWKSAFGNVKGVFRKQS